jgi:hypothetical protein
MEDINGKYLMSVGNTYLHTYPIESAGKIGKQISSTDTASYGGSQCGGTSGQGSVMDHTGKYLYVQLNTTNTCAAWQSYKIQSNGNLEFLGDVEYSATDNYNGYALSSSPPTISSNDEYGYGVFPAGADYYTQLNTVSAFQKASNGQLEINESFSETDPAPCWDGYGDENLYFYQPQLVQADPSSYVAVVVYSYYAGWQMANYTINPSTGAIWSINTCADMVISWNGYPQSLSMSPSGKLVALASHSGLEVFHFNRAEPITRFTGQLQVAFNFDQVAWDHSNHLYALSYDSAQLFVYTITPSSFTEAPGSPYHLPKAPYGVKGMVVTP